MGADILFMLMPLAMPYLTAYLEKYLGSMIPGKRKKA